MPRLLAAVIALALSLGCDWGGNPTPEILSQSVSKPAPPYRPVVNVRQTMEWILDPAVDVIWDSAGFIITAEGETDLSPTSDEGWEHVRNSAAVVAETGNLLLMPARSAGPDWVAHAQGLTEAGELALAAAESRDAEALFDAGGRIYVACRSCHEQYLVPLEAARNPE